MKKNITMMAKEEVAIPSELHCAEAFLSALVHSIGSIIISKGDIGIEITSGNNKLLRAASKLFFEIFGVRASVEGKTLTVAVGAMEILRRLGILHDDDGVKIERGIATKFLGEHILIQNYCKGVFLGTGTVFAPKKGGYHLEFVFNDIDFADDFSSLLFEEGIPAKIRIKKDKPAVYIKAIESVSDFLALVGAGGAVLHINSLAAERQMRGIANRNENCDLANIERSVNASVRLISKLQGITDKIYDKELRETAEARIKYADATYSELAEKLNISKSGLAHRLKRLQSLADELSNNNE